MRWFQFAAFCPLFRVARPHVEAAPAVGMEHRRARSQRDTELHIPDPDSELHNAAVEPICRKYLELRYRLMPYLYSRRARMPRDRHADHARACGCTTRTIAAAVARGDQYLWGRDILVAPVVEKGATSRQVYLPRGAWYDFWTGEQHRGRPRDHPQGRSGDDAALRPRRGDPADGSGQAVHGGEGGRAADGSDPPRRRRRVLCSTRTTARPSTSAAANGWGWRWPGATHARR